MMSAFAIPFMAVSPPTKVDAGRMEIEGRFFSFIHEQVSARLFAIQREGAAAARSASRAPAAVDLVPSESDIIAAHAQLNADGRRLAIRITNAIFVEGRHYNFDPLTVFTIIDQESRMDVRATGSVGERGLIQIRPSTAQATAKKMKIKFAADRLYEPEYNLHVGLAYLKILQKRYHAYDMSYLDAYNMGPAKMIQRSVASGSKAKYFKYSRTLAKRREILMSEFTEHVAKLGQSLTGLRSASAE